MSARCGILDFALRRGGSGARWLLASTGSAGTNDPALHDPPTPMAATAQLKKLWKAQLGGPPLSDISMHHAFSAVVTSASKASTVHTLRPMVEKMTPNTK